MPKRMSSRDRIERLRAEKEAAEREKAEKKKSAAPRKRAAARTRASASPAARLKVVWAVCRLGADVVETYPYPQRAQADAAAARLNREKPGDYIVRPEKVPME